MNIVICGTYHETHKVQADVVYNYYTSLGYKVDNQVVDFKETPEHEARNHFFKRNSDADYILSIDSDEIILPSDLLKLVCTIDKTKKEVYRCGLINYLTPNTISDLPEIHKPIIAVINGEKHGNEVRFKYNRNVKKCNTYEEVDIKIHHLGYMMNTEFKIQNYIDRKEFHELGTTKAVIDSKHKLYDTPPQVRQIISRITRL